MGDKVYVVPVRVRLKFLGFTIRKKIKFVKVYATSRRCAQKKAVEEVKGSFSHILETTEVLNPLLDVEFMALMRRSPKQAN